MAPRGHPCSTTLLSRPVRPSGIVEFSSQRPWASFPHRLGGSQQISY